MRCCIPLQICEYLREYYLWRSKHPPQRPELTSGKLLPSFGSQGESGVTNGNGERLNFPALSGSRRVAGSKVNSLPSLDKINVFVMEMQSVTRDSHQELQ